MIALLLASAAAVAVPVDTSSCATIAPVTTATDVVALQRDADCFGAAATSDSAGASVLSKAASAAKAAQKYRLARIAYVKAHPPVQPPPPPTTDTSVPTKGLPDIPSNFDVASQIVPSAIPAENTDTLGAFRFTCAAGQVRQDDPIVFPGKFNVGHLHQYFGNTGANGASTYESLRATGDSTCGLLNRSAYWMPAMLDGKGNVVRPDFVTIYYKRKKASDPTLEGIPVGLTNGVRFIFGYDMLNPANPENAKQRFYWQCDGPTKKSGAAFDRMDDALANCPAGNRIGVGSQSWHCWDGKSLDSADHRSHMSYVAFDGTAYRCPKTHPYAPPSFIISAWWMILPTDDPSKWMLSSDMMHPELPRGATWHADWFGAWDPVAVKTWIDNCINKHLSCQSAELGDGTGMRGDPNLNLGVSNPHLVPVPAGGM